MTSLRMIQEIPTIISAAVCLAIASRISSEILQINLQGFFPLQAYFQRSFQIFVHRFFFFRNWLHDSVFFEKFSKFPPTISFFFRGLLYFLNRQELLHNFFYLIYHKVNPYFYFFSDIFWTFEEHSHFFSETVKQYFLISKNL